MYSENQVKEMVQQVLTEMLTEQGVDKRGSEKNVPMAQPPHTAEFSARAIPPQPTAGYEEGVIDDITAAPLQEQFFVPHPADREGYLAMKEFTPARLGVWRAGPRYNTVSMLRFRADHATAQDSVFSDVDPAYVEKSGWVGGQSQCADRDEYVTRPDKGRLLDSETRARYEKELQKNAKVLIMVGDGLSSAAIAANAGDIIPAIRQGLQAQGIEAGPVPFVRFCRVGAMDDIGELTGAEVVCCLIGERPGLVTSESMSAYIAYRPTVGMAESRRTVVSNIHRGGTPAVEAGAHIAGLLGRILKEKVSGVELSL